MTAQDQFLTVIDRDEAERRFHAALALTPLPAERVPLPLALGRVLAESVRSPVDVPSFDRSNVDGYALRAADTEQASELAPRPLHLLPESIPTGVVPAARIEPGQAIAIATGGMLPRGADAVVMVEHTDVEPSEVRRLDAKNADAAQSATSPRLLVRRPLPAGANLAFAGTDIAAGELVLHAGERLSSRETGVLAAIGVAEVAVVRRPRVAVLSTGDEIIPPGEPMRASLIYDSNARIIADAVRELGGEPVELGIVRDDAGALRARLNEALATCDVVLLSGGTSKGAGDLCYRVASEWTDPGIVAHGVALKPGKPICLAATRGKPFVILPGFPTSAIFTFHEFVAPVIRRLAGLRAEERRAVTATLATKINSEIGRTEYLLVNLAEASPALASANAASTSPAPQAGPSLVAWPLGKGSGSVTTFSRADGFVTIDRHQEIVERGAPVSVNLLGHDWSPADLVVIGSHCTGLDWLLEQMHARGWRTRLLTVGSTAGLEAAKREQCDLAGIHLLDLATGQYNRPFLTGSLTLVRGYTRLQVLAFRPGDPRFARLSVAETAQALQRALADPACVMVNRNQGSGTRILIDQLLEGRTPPGYAVQPKNHTAVAAAIVQNRADWGVCIESAARHAGLAFLPLQPEHYDFAIPKARLSRPAVQAFLKLLNDPQVAEALNQLGLTRQGAAASAGG